MKFIICMILIISVTYSVSAQTCNCSDNFRFMVNKVKKNYVGYPDKVNSNNIRYFEKFTDSLQNVSNRSNPYECISVCREWLTFFKDKHVNFTINFDVISPDSIRLFFSNEEKTNWNEKTFKTYLTHNRNNLDEIEGIWSYGVYEVGIIKDVTKKNQEFIAFVLKADGSRWVPQQIKFRIAKFKNMYKTVFFRGGDHSMNYPKLIQQKNILDFDFFGKWQKEPYKHKELAEKEADLTPKFKILDNETCLFEMPSFESLAYAAKVDSIVKKNEIILKQTKHLIIDLRDNGGGSTSVYKSLLPYIYTNPILTVGGVVLATEDNIKDGYSTEYPEASDSIKNSLKKDLATLKEHKGELYNLYPIDTIKFEKVFKNPQRISVLVNDNTGSAAELFLLQLKQSKKVKLYGTNSSGVVDYGETVVSMMPCKYYSLIYPAAKSLYSIKHPLDNVGVNPDIVISDKAIDWIDFVRTYKK
ncbi:S41 family peptidase [Pedobacter sp. N23S346]|uniref:S41 family peptidase n=1 Tax=Pedobacter sp. N23S346 TaxID=3402750 RepID=UPI003AD7632A